MKKRLRFFGVGLLIILLLWSMRESILSSVGRFLISTDEQQSAQRIFVLGGNSYDRGYKAARLWHQGMAPKVLCTGDHIPTSIKSIGDSVSLADLAAIRVRSLDVDSVNVEAHTVGTSTMEESEFILQKCLDNGWNKIILISDLFHTRRLRYVFEDKFRENGIQVIIIGAESSNYDEAQWWNYEEGLIMVNNEYIKLFYYIWKY